VKDLLDAFWRAVAYCLHPRVVLWSLLPLAVAGAALGLLGWFYWEAAVAAVRGTLERWELVAAMLRWLEEIGAAGLRAVLAPLIVVALMVPLVVIAALLLVALMMTPAIVALVAQRRFPKLERRRGGGWWQGLLWSLTCTAAALLALVVSVPLWFVPPLIVLLPPLIWGWLTYRVLSYDVLAAHASAPERRLLVQRHRWPLLAMGVASGYLGAAPSALWALGAATLILAPVLAVVSVWLYTLVFAFAACWFAHYLLAALARLRAEPVEAEIVEPATPAAAALLPPTGTPP
jgi:hypothetical protein